MALTNQQIDADEARIVRVEARRLFNKYGGSAALKALYRATRPGDFYDQVSIAILRLERAA